MIKTKLTIITERKMFFLIITSPFFLIIPKLNFQNYSNITIRHKF